jgi:hypothetical protein
MTSTCYFLVLPAHFFSFPWNPKAANQCLFRQATRTEMSRSPKSQQRVRKTLGVFRFRKADFACDRAFQHLEGRIAHHEVQVHFAVCPEGQPKALFYGLTRGSQAKSLETRRKPGRRSRLSNKSESDSAGEDDDDDGKSAKKVCNTSLPCTPYRWLPFPCEARHQTQTLSPFALVREGLFV